MQDPIIIGEGVLVPAEAIEMRAVRASGPGGQNVNKVATKVELRIDLTRIHGIDSESRHRLLRQVSKRLDRSGRLLVTSQRTRDQHRNLADACKKVHDWIARALQPPRARVASEPGPGSNERRLLHKKRHARRKADRRRVITNDE